MSGPRDRRRTATPAADLAADTPTLRLVEFGVPSLPGPWTYPHAFTDEDSATAAAERLLNLPAHRRPTRVQIVDAATGHVRATITAGAEGGPFA